jgi:hypothetical protein
VYAHCPLFSPVVFCSILQFEVFLIIFAILNSLILFHCVGRFSCNIGDF